MDGSDKQAASPITIKKYANRRLYNTAKSSYITLDHLSEMVRDGADFVVYDAKTGEDITRSVLTQIIFEEEAKGKAMLPAAFLRQIIRLYGDTLQGMVPGYLEASMEAFTRNQEKMREQMRASFGANAAMQTFETMTRANMEIFQKAMSMMTPHASGGEAPKAEAATAKAGDDGAPGKTADADDDLESMKTRLREMQAQLDKIAKGS
jgi:polyhydroxyalkanoate synthesis repressor PhaR